MNPVITSTVKPVGMQSSPQTGSMLLLAFVLIFIIAAAYYATRLVARRGNMPGAFGGSRLRVLEKLSVSRDRCILLVRLNDSIYLIGVSSGGISLLDKLAPEEAAQMTENVKNPLRPDAFSSFGEFLKRSVFKKTAGNTGGQSFKETLGEAGLSEGEGREMTKDELDAMMLMMEKRRKKMNLQDETGDKH